MVQRANLARREGGEGLGLQASLKIVDSPSHVALQSVPAPPLMSQP